MRYLIAISAALFLLLTIGAPLANCADATEAETASPHSCCDDQTSKDSPTKDDCCGDNCFCDLALTRYLTPESPLIFDEPVFHSRNDGFSFLPLIGRVVDSRLDQPPQILAS